MNSIKLYYLDFLAGILHYQWKSIHTYFKITQTPYWNKNTTTSNTISANSTYEVSGSGGIGFRKTKSVNDENNGNDDNDDNYSLSGKLTRLLSSPSSFPVSSSTKSSSTKIGDGVLLSTNDAHTLTDGVTIFFAEDVDKIGAFLIHQSKIPVRVLDNIAQKISHNQLVQKRLEKMTKNLDDKLASDITKQRKMEKESFSPEIKQLMNEISILKTTIMRISLENQYIPNTRTHQEIWNTSGTFVPNAFVPNVDESVVKEVMELNVSVQKKILLLMGIGVFSISEDSKYMDCMKKLCFEQKLYLIVANSDFIYGINYQLCHAFFGKDIMLSLTQQKIIQAIGRVGRGNVQQEYTVRIRDDNVFRKLFLPCERNIEAENMCRLFCANE
jgi:hypothetical protein